MVEELKQRKFVEQQTKLDEASANLMKFASEIKTYDRFIQFYGLLLDILIGGLTKKNSP